mgnify:CR=1 FL=1
MTPVSTTIFTLRGLAADRDIDGGISAYRITGQQGAFSIAGGASEGFIVVSGELDYDAGPQMYVLNITTTVSVTWLVFFDSTFTASLK